jgi:hypothetical protein
MGFSDVASVLSRRFILGTFIPLVAALVILWQVVDDAFLPQVLEQRADGTGLLVIGASAVVLGLLCQATTYPVLRLLEGYPLIDHSTKLANWLKTKQERTRRDLTTLSDAVAPEGSTESAVRETQRRADNAGFRLYREFPPEGVDVLPTRFGNALRAAERYPNDRYGMDGVVFWPRLEPLFTEQERALQDDAQTSIDLFVNVLLAGIASGLILVVDAIFFSTIALDFPLRFAPFGVAAFAYSQAVRAAVGWGDQIRATFDLHRLDIYQAMGLKRPTSLSQERERAETLGQFIVYGRLADIPDDWVETNSVRPGMAQDL